MAIKILIGDKNNVDFGSHIEMNLDERKRFIILMELLFKPLEREETIQFIRNWRVGENERIQYPHPWTSKEYEVLLNASSIEDAINCLGRSGMSIIIQSGVWIPKYYLWCAKKKKEVNEWNNNDTIKEFLKECKDLIKCNRQKRTAEKIIPKIKEKIKKINEKIEDLKYEESLEFTSVSRNAKIKHKELEEQMKKLEEELVKSESLKKQ